MTRMPLRRNSMPLNLSDFPGFKWMMNCRAMTGSASPALQKQENSRAKTGCDVTVTRGGK